jgi:hypothetical protein
LRSCGAYAAGVLELQNLRLGLETLARDPDALVRETAATALSRLDGRDAALGEAPEAAVKESGVFKAPTELVGLG